VSVMNPRLQPTAPPGPRGWRSRPIAAAETPAVRLPRFPVWTLGWVVLVSGLLLRPVSIPANASTPSRPNILVIVTDDQRAGGTMRVLPETRRLFQRQGTRFPRAIAPTPTCCPARASIFTGRYVHNHGVRTNRDATRLDHATTVQSYLDQAGYTTAIVGKFLNGWKLTESPPFFSRFAVTNKQGSYYDFDVNRDGTIESLNRYLTDYVASRAARFIHDFEERDDRPWLLFVAPPAPHPPFTVEERYEGAAIPTWNGNPAVFEEDKRDKPPHVRRATGTLTTARPIRAKQLRTLMSVDDLVERLFAGLSRNGESNRTLAFYVSDNGYLWSEHGLSGKASPYRQSIEVPLMMRWPGVAPRGRRDSRLVGVIDIAPTILDAVGVSPPDPMDGRSLLRSGWERDRILAEGRLAAGNPWRSTVGETYQFVEIQDRDTGEITFREYYDLSDDPWQLENLYGDSDPDNDPPPEVTAALSTQLVRDRRCLGTSGPDACP
jgi:arylsulfatase A-like enzyme